MTSANRRLHDKLKAPSRVACSDLLGGKIIHESKISKYTAPDSRPTPTKVTQPASLCARCWRPLKSIRNRHKIQSINPDSSHVCCRTLGRLTPTNIPKAAEPTIKSRRWLCASCLIVWSRSSCRLTSRAQARGTNQRQPRSGTGPAIPRCLQRFVRRRFHLAI